MKRIITLAVLVFCILFLTLISSATEFDAESSAGVIEDTELTALQNAASPAEDQAEEVSAEETVSNMDLLDGETAIRSMEILCVVSETGQVTVKQSLEISIVGSVQEIRIALPKSAQKRDVVGYKFKYDVEDGIGYLIISDKNGFAGLQKIQISYIMRDVVSAGEEMQQLKMTVMEGQKYRVGSVSLSVNLPKDFESYPSFYSGYYGELIEDYMTYGVENTAVTAAVHTVLQDSDTLSMLLTVPPGYFEGRLGQSVLPTTLSVLCCILLFAAAVYWWRTMGFSRLRIHARSLPPDGVQPGELPFLLTGADADFNLLISHWASLGYLEIYVDKKGHVLLYRRMAMGNERRYYERKLFSWLFENGDVCDSASLRYQKIGRKSVHIIRKFWRTRLFDKNGGSPGLLKIVICLAGGLLTVSAVDGFAPDKVHGLFLIIGFVAGYSLSWFMDRLYIGLFLNHQLLTALGSTAVLLLLLLSGLGGILGMGLIYVCAGLFFFWQTIHGGRRTAYGNEILGQTLGFRRFLKQATENDMLQMMRRNPQYFYKILPYAQALGLGSQFSSMFRAAELEPCSWLQTARGKTTSAAGFFERFTDVLDMLKMSLES